MDRKPTIPLYVGLFTLAYIILVILIGYAIVWLQIDSFTRVNEFVIVAAACITTYWFTRRQSRHFTKQEHFEIVFGSVAADITIQITTPLMFSSNFDLSKKWLLYSLILVGHALLIVISYSLLQKIPYQAKRPNP
jgi:hypothetical protein